MSTERMNLQNNDNNMNNQKILIITMASVLLASSLEEMGKNPHCHEGLYEATLTVQKCATYVTGSYSSMASFEGKYRD